VAQLGTRTWHFAYGKSPHAASASPVPWGNRVVVADRRDALVGLSSETGALIWAVTVAPGFNGTPCIDDDGQIYAGTGRPGIGHSGQLLAIAATDGAISWKRELPSAWCAGPTLVGGAVVATAQDGCVYAFARSDGALRWRTRIDGLAMTTPTLGPDHLVWIGVEAGRLHGLRADDGEVVATIALAAPLNRTLAAGPHGVVATTLDGRVACVVDGAIAWTTALGGHHPSAPSLVGDRVLIGGGAADVDRAGLHVLDAATGDQRGFVAVPGVIHGAPALGDGLAYVTSTDHRVHALDLETGSERWSYGTGAELWAAPRADDATLYVAAHNGCYALS